MAATIVTATATVVNMDEVRSMARGYFAGKIALGSIEGAMSREFEIALYREFAKAREQARKDGQRKIVGKIYTIQYKVLPSWFKGEQRRNKRAKVA